MSIQMIDMILVGISLFILVQAYKNGLILSVLKLLGWLIAAYISISYATSRRLDPLISSYLPSNSIPPFWVFTGVGSLISCLLRTVRKLLRKVKILGLFDHLLGLCAGFIEVYLFLWIVFQVMTIWPISIDPQQSLLYPYIQEVENYVPYSIPI